jgi:dTDP-3-amino-3,4,6-trideoxy-alpha-D-glucose transaminase
VPVHLYGHPAALDPLRDFASRHALVLVEDCCQAHLATYRARPVGTGGAGGAFSFYPTKNLGALGDGGAIVTNDASIAERVRILRNGGQVRRHEHAEAGMNSRLDELQAAVLRARLLHLSAWTARRREIGQFYRAHLPRTVAPLPERDPGHVYHLFPVRSSRRDALRESLGGAGIDTLVHYPRTLGSQPAFAAYGPASCPEAERAAGELVSLPLHPRLTDDQARAVVDAVGRFTP